TSQVKRKMYHGVRDALMLLLKDEFRTCWGRVEELLVAEELWNDYKKLIFFLVASAATCTASHLEVDQRRKDWSAIQGTILALSGSGTDPVNATARYVAFRGLIATAQLSPTECDVYYVAIWLPDLTDMSPSLLVPVAT
ncbi:hypothetical protein Taro_046235, partial [Colocasia esculenta]|nr:hypothetical protein [Colocasia esculenta]